MQVSGPLSLHLSLPWYSASKRSFLRHPALKSMLPQLSENFTLCLSFSFQWWDSESASGKKLRLTVSPTSFACLEDASPALSVVNSLKRVVSFFTPIFLLVNTRMASSILVTESHLEAKFLL